LEKLACPLNDKINAIRENQTLLEIRDWLLLMLINPKL
jgi:hypothetical protein